MNDPHVESLTYNIIAGEGIEFDNPEPLEHKWNSFFFKLENGIMTVTPKDHFSTKEEARAAVEPYLDAWEFEHALRNGRRNVTFKYTDAKIIDLKPPAPGDTLFVYTGNIVLVSEVHADVIALWNKYPDPPTVFTSVPPDAESLWNRFERYLNNREPLHGMAYFFVTVLEAASAERPPRQSKKRLEASKKYRIEYEVIDTLGESSSTRGDTNTGRKFGSTPLRAIEEVWMEAVVRAIIRRVAERRLTSDAASLPWIKMQDLPPL
jgi:hypothetical protein